MIDTVVNIALMYKLVKSLSRTPETNITLCINYMQERKEGNLYLENIWNDRQAILNNTKTIAADDRNNH